MKAFGIGLRFSLANASITGLKLKFIFCLPPYFTGGSGLTNVKVNLRTNSRGNCCLYGIRRGTQSPDVWFGLVCEAIFYQIQLVIHEYERVKVGLEVYK